MTSEAAHAPAVPVDYRFTLANERTFLAWIRTALGLLAGGVAVHTLVQPFHHAGVRRALATSCIALAIVVSLGALRHWKGIRDAMNRGAPLRETRMVPILAFGIAAVSVFAAVAVL
ncbi:YidH family protein [Nocardia sp. NPDC056100]|uniref:YidH family protein n=1 Tax=Nocardia sp. NPDC056100 TaxID=3345712 RepID=UPI0035D688D5